MGGETQVQLLLPLLRVQVVPDLPVSGRAASLGAARGSPIPWCSGVRIRPKTYLSQPRLGLKLVERRTRRHVAGKYPSHAPAQLLAVRIDPAAVDPADRAPVAVPAPVVHLRGFAGADGGKGVSRAAPERLLQFRCVDRVEPHPHLRFVDQNGDGIAITDLHHAAGEVGEGGDGREGKDDETQNHPR